MAISVLGKGSLSAASEVNIVTSGTGQTKSISSLVLCNTSANDITVIVRILNAANDKTKLTAVTLAAGDGKSRIVPEAIGGLGPDFKLSLEPSTASGVDYTAYGATTST